jgi:hypothetical protein
VYLPVLVLLIAAPACSCPDLEDSVGPGTIRISVTGGRESKAILRVEDCERLARPKEIVKDFTVRDEDGREVGHVTVRGRDVVMRKAGVNGRRCRIEAVKEVDVQTGASYEITADDETVSTGFPTDEASCVGDDSSYYLNEAGVRLFVRVPRSRLRAREHLALAEQEYRSIVAIARMWNIPKDRVKQIVKRDDFPAPMDIGIGRTYLTRLWLLEDLEAWWFRDGRHAPR